MKFGLGFLSGNIASDPFAESETPWEISVFSRICDGAGAQSSVSLFEREPTFPGENIMALSDDFSIPVPKILKTPNPTATIKHNETANQKNSFGIFGKTKYPF